MNFSTWACLHALIWCLHEEGETEAADLLARMPEKAEDIRKLAYHMYVTCERSKRAKDALAYNRLIQSWDRMRGIER